MRVRVRLGVREFKWLTPDKDYLVLGLDDEYFRVLDDKGDPVLFPRGVFDVVDGGVPDDWIWDEYAQGEFYADPPELHATGFYEDYFDGEEHARNAFNSYLRRVGLNPPHPGATVDEPSEFSSSGDT